MADLDYDWGRVLQGLEKDDPEAVLEVTDLVSGFLARFGAYEVRPAWSDIIQEVLIALVRASKRGAIREPRAFVSYVGTTTRNHLANWLRRNRRVSANELKIAPELAEQLTTESIMPPRAEDPELLVDMDRALSKLTEAERKAIDAIYFQGRTYEEAASLLRLSLGTLKNLQVRGLRELRRHMGINL
jgi:RNA polymerase sigma factor (sigma-70 family)